MSQRRTGCVRGSFQGGGDELRLDVLLLAPVERIDGDMDGRRSIDGRRDERTADQCVALISEHGPCPVRPEVPACGSSPLGFGQRRMAVERFTARQECREIRELGGVEFAQDQHVHACTLTRYRDGVGRPENAEGYGAGGDAAPG